MVIISLAFNFSSGSGMIRDWWIMRRLVGRSGKKEFGQLSGVWFFACFWSGRNGPWNMGGLMIIYNECNAIKQLLNNQDWSCLSVILRVCETNLVLVKCE